MATETLVRQSKLGGDVSQNFIDGAASVNLASLPYGDYPANIFVPISTVTIAAASLTVTGLHGIHSGQFKITGLTAETIALTGLSDAGTNMGAIKVEFTNTAGTPNSALLANGDYRIAPPLTVAALVFTKSAAAETVTIVGLLSGAS